MGLLSTVGQFASAVTPLLDHLLSSRTSSGLGSWTAGYVDQQYEPIHPTPKGFTLVFFFFSPVFEYLVFNYADHHYAKALEKFLRYQHVILVSGDIGSLTAETQTVSDGNFIKYKYPLKVSSSGTASFTFIDHFYAFTCLTKAQCIGQALGQLGGMLGGTIGKLASVAGQIIGGLSGQTGFHSVVRPVFDLWFDLFVPFSRQIFVAQRAVTNPQKGGSERYIQLPKEELQLFNAYAQLVVDSNNLKKILIFQPDMVYKANALIIQVSPDYNASVINAYYVVGMYPTNYPLLNHDYNASGLETITVTFNYDYVFTGKDVLDLAKRLVNTPLGVLKPQISGGGSIGSLTASIMSKLKNLVSNKKQPSSASIAQVACFKSKLGQAPIFPGKAQGLVSSVTNLLSPGIM